MNGSSLNFTPNFVTGSSLNFTPNFVTGSSLNFTPNTVLTFGPPTGLNFNNSTSSGSVDLATLNQSILTLNATMTQTNTLLAKLNGGDGGTPAPGTPPPGGGFGAPLSLSSTSPHMTALDRHKAHFEANIASGNLLEARQQWERSVAYQQKWDAANKEMEAKLRALKAIP